MIKLNKADFEKILAHARTEAPVEACGLIAGRIEDGNKLIDKVYILTNVDHAEEHFTLDPKEQLAAVKDMRANGLVPLGNWHSHPVSPSRPSQEDSVWLMTAGQVISYSRSWTKMLPCSIRSISRVMTLRM